MGCGGESAAGCEGSTQARISRNHLSNVQQAQARGPDCISCRCLWHYPGEWVVGLQEAAAAMHSVCNTGADSLKVPHTLFVVGEGAAISSCPNVMEALKRVVAILFSAGSAGLRASSNYYLFLLAVQQSLEVLKILYPGERAATTLTMAEQARHCSSNQTSTTLDSDEKSRPQFLLSTSSLQLERG